MALRTIRVEGDPVLTKISRPVDKMTPRIQAPDHRYAGYHV